MWSEFEIQMSAELVSFDADLTLRPLIVGFFSMTCGHFKNMTILGLGISLLCYSRKSRSLAGSVVQWEAPKGLPAVPGWAREGISLLLLRPAFPASRPVFAAQRLPEVTAFQGLWAAVLVHKTWGASFWEVPGRRVPWWVLLPENPEASALLQKQTFVLPGHRLAYLPGFT